MRSLYVVIVVLLLLGAIIALGSFRVLSDLDELLTFDSGVEEDVENSDPLPGTEGDSDIVDPDPSPGTGNDGDETPDSSTDTESGGDDGQNELLNVSASLVMRSEPEFMFSGEGGNAQTGIRFITDVSADLAESIKNDSSLAVYTVVAPLDYFDQVYDSDATMDWISAFDDAGLYYSKIESELREETVGDSITVVIRSAVTDITYKNTNRKFTMISLVEKTAADGTVTRAYAGYKYGQNFQTIARSVAYVAIDAYNQMFVNGVLEENSAKAAAIAEIMGDSVALSNGVLDDAENAGAIYTLDQFNYIVEMIEGTDYVMPIAISPSAEVPVLWYSENEDVAEVNNGEITTVGAGTTEIVAVLCGVEYRCSLTSVYPDYEA